jgi:hypothetical protein
MASGERFTDALSPDMNQELGGQPPICSTLGSGGFSHKGTKTLTEIGLTPLGMTIFGDRLPPSSRGAEGQ